MKIIAQLTDYLFMFILLYRNVNLKLYFILTLTRIINNIKTNKNTFDSDCIIISRKCSNEGTVENKIFS